MASGKQRAHTWTTWTPSVATTQRRNHLQCLSFVLVLLRCLQFTCFLLCINKEGDCTSTSQAALLTKLQDLQALTIIFMSTLCTESILMGKDYGSK